MADKKIAQFSQDIGIASLGVDEENLKKLASVRGKLYGCRKFNKC